MIHRYPGKRRREAASQCYGRIGKGSGCRKPIGRRDHQPYEPWDRLGENRTPPRIVRISVKVATASASHCDGPLRGFMPMAIGARSNIRWASIVPQMPPAHWTRIYGITSFQMPSRAAKTSVTAGLKWAPETGPRNCNDDDQDGAGGNGVAEQRDSLISAGQPLGHDAGTDDGCDQDGGSETFCQQTARERGRCAHSVTVSGFSGASLILPTASNRFCNAS